MMELTVLGMNGPFPSPDGACSGYLLCAGDTRLQLDLGTGVLAALTGRMAPEELDAVVLSHWHFDHSSDILPLMYRLEGLVAAGYRPLTVYAPVDEASPVRAAVKASKALTLINVAPGDEITVGGVRVCVFAARHPVPAVMYRMTDGEKVFCYTGDTNTIDTLPGFVQGADLLLADGLFTQVLWAEQKPHLAAAQCAALAREHGVRRLVITHLNPNIDPQTLLSEARAEWPQAELARRFAVYTV